MRDQRLRRWLTGYAYACARKRGDEGPETFGSVWPMVWRRRFGTSHDVAVDHDSDAPACEHRSEQPTTESACDTDSTRAD